jgi:universal stress protein A
MSLKLTRILCPVDFSEPSDVAVRWAADLAAQFGAALTLLHVYQDPAFVLPDGGVLMPQPDVLAQVLAGANERLARVKQDAMARGAQRVDTVALQGVPWAEIKRLATEGEYSMIVIGTHGRTGIKHVLLGSVAERVARHGPCPVLVVH